MRPTAILCFLPFALCATAASAEPAKIIAPALTRPAVRAQADATLGAQLAALPSATRERLAGTYVAVDEDESDPYAMISCDDDGDHVVVLSAAMLEVVTRVAEALSGEDSAARLSSYAGALGRQPSGARLVPPPPGFYDGPHDPARASAALSELLGALIGGELLRLARGHLVCAHPTPQRESGDATWTARERAFAFQLAPRLYDGAHAVEIASPPEAYKSFVAVMASTAFTWGRLHPAKAL